MWFHCQKSTPQISNNIRRYMHFTISQQFKEDSQNSFQVRGIRHSNVNRKRDRPECLSKLRFRDPSCWLFIEGECSEILRHFCIHFLRRVAMLGINCDTAALSCLKTNKGVHVHWWNSETESHYTSDRPPSKNVPHHIQIIPSNKIH